MGMRKLLFSLALVAGAAAAATTGTLTEQSQVRARKIIDQAVTAIGGRAALESIEVVRLDLQGETFPRLQMTTPNPPFEPGRFHETLLLDLKRNRLLLEQRTSGAGFDGDLTVAIANGEGTIYDHRARTATPVPPAQTSQQQFIQYQRRLPHLILRQALERANSLRYLGEDTHEGRRHHVVTFVMADTQQIALYIDAKTNLVSKYELVFTDPLRGQQASQIMFGSYVSAGPLMVPQQWSWRFAGDLVARYKAEIEFNPALTDRSFAVAAEGYEKVAAQPQTLEERVERLADNVIVVHNVADQNYNTMAVAFRDYIVAVEAPGTSDGADRVIARIKETWPGKPIRYVALTHHHSDHIGGLRSFLAEGATVITTRANRGVVETMAVAPQNDRLARAPRKPEFLFVEGGQRVLTDGDQTLELIDVGPNPHAKEMLIAWLPAQKIVFQGDLFFMPNNGAPVGPPQSSTLDFARKMQARGLAPQRIASVHGRTATIEEFRTAVEGNPVTSQAPKLK
jgi:glyoxylase-like metal-dependent hydrolase (beta-lactamase superfamily II)